MNEINQGMLQAAQEALQFAYAPYSKYKVAACIVTDLGNFYTGVNVENGSYGLTLCAEASAIGSMVSAGEQRIAHILVIAGNDEFCAPCGACRQRIFEFSTKKTQVYLCKDRKISSTMKVNELLPLAFDFKPQ
ncbi:MAG: cytidine deaminase [Legionella sp.]|nr:cytidine deaminase [Legionella sp.]